MHSQQLDLIGRTDLNHGLNNPGDTGLCVRIEFTGRVHSHIRLKLL